MVNGYDVDSVLSVAYRVLAARQLYMTILHGRCDRLKMASFTVDKFAADVCCASLHLQLFLSAVTSTSHTEIKDYVSAST